MFNTLLDERGYVKLKSHVDFHEENPKAKTGKFVVKIDTLQRNRQVDVCAQCHSGPRIHIKEPFSYVVGNRLEDYSHPSLQSQNGRELDVHANQVGLLKASKCYKMSLGMDCATCHNVHSDQRGKSSEFITKCISCHGDNGHMCSNLLTSPKGENNCIDCHMPMIETKNISIFSHEDSLKVKTSMRTHFIAVYDSLSNSKELIEFVDNSI